MTTTRPPRHAARFPGEDDSYRAARDSLLDAELALRRQIEAVAAQRRTLPPGGVVPVGYEFLEWDRAACAPRTVRFSELFAPGKDTLILYSFMFNPGPTGPLEIACPMCTSMLDGLDGELLHITQRVNFVVAAKAPLDRFLAHAHSRGWRYARLLSSAGTSYNLDYHAESSDAEQRPMSTVFVRDGDVIRHFWSSELLMAPLDDGQGPRHIDYMWPLWSVLDRTPAGRGDFMPELDYRQSAAP